MANLIQLVSDETEQIQKVFNENQEQKLELKIQREKEEDNDESELILNENTEDEKEPKRGENSSTAELLANVEKTKEKEREEKEEEEELKGISKDLVELLISQALVRARERLTAREASAKDEQQQVNQAQQSTSSISLKRQVITSTSMSNHQKITQNKLEETLDLNSDASQEQDLPSLVKQNIINNNNLSEDEGESEKFGQSVEILSSPIDENVALDAKELPFNGTTNSLINSSSANSSTSLSNAREDITEDSEDDEVGGDFCGEAASESTLRRIRLDTFEDVLVCEQNRHSMQLARQLFDELSKKTSASSTSQANHHNNNNKLRSGSLSSASGSSEQEGVASPTNDSIHTKGESSGGGGRFQMDHLGCEQYDSVKLVRRANSSASNVSNLNFRQTLVCSVSPINGGEYSTGSNSCSSQDNMSVQLENHLYPAHPLYPIDGTEIEQCRAAFRENKRLIEEQQRELLLRKQQQEQQSSTSALQRPASCPANSQWIEKFRRDCLLSNRERVCSHCKQRLYPVDKMELDFTKTTLEIHRNCFKCQVCSTLLRLETYAALDAKLYCPAHIKCVTPSR